MLSVVLQDGGVAGDGAGLCSASSCPTEFTCEYKPSGDRYSQTSTISEHLQRLNNLKKNLHFN